VLVCVLNHCHCQRCEYVYASELGLSYILLFDRIIKETYAFNLNVLTYRHLLIDKNRGDIYGVLFRNIICMKSGLCRRNSKYRGIDDIWINKDT